VLLTLLLAATGCGDQGANKPPLPKTIVGIDPSSKEPRFEFTAPDGFEWNDQHRIFYNKQLRTSIQLAHGAETTFESVVDDFSAEKMRASNMELISKEVRQIDGRDTLLVHANRLNAKYPQQSCTVAYGTETGCAQITAIYPTEMAQSMKTAIESALLKSTYGVPNESSE
jgi:hypothetical protein